MADAEKAFKSTENMKIQKREIRAEFCQKQKSDLGEGVFTFTYVLSCLAHVAASLEMSLRLGLMIKKLLKFSTFPNLHVYQ